MTNVSFSAQTIRVQNPFIPLARTRLLVGAVAVLAALGSLLFIQPILSNLLASGQMGASRTWVVLLFAAMCVGWLLYGIGYVIEGFRFSGPQLIVPPRTPADFKGTSVIEKLLVRQEFQSVGMPINGVAGWAQRFMRDRLFFGTKRELKLLEESVRFLEKAIGLLIAVVAWWFIGERLFGDAQLFVWLFPILGWTAPAIVVSAVVRAMAIPLLLPNTAPVADRVEHTRLVRGGGDPNSLRPMVEQEFLKFREQEIPNRSDGALEMQSGKVADTGAYALRMWVETQPQPLAPVSSKLTTLYLAGGAALWLVGIGVAVFGLMSRSVSTLSMTTWVALVWTRLGFELFESAHLHLSRFRYRSTITFLLSEGTIGRSEVKAGKSWNDSFESANLVVRSDSAMRAYSASIESETLALMGERFVVRAERDDRATAAMKVLTDALDAYERAGIVVRPIDMGDGGLNQVAQANLAYRQAAASVESSPRDAAPPMLTGAPGATADRQLPEAVAPAPAAAPAEDTKICPMCAETIKAAAKKCRFCGEVFEESAKPAE